MIGRLLSIEDVMKSSGMFNKTHTMRFHAVNERLEKEVFCFDGDANLTFYENHSSGIQVRRSKKSIEILHKKHGHVSLDASISPSVNLILWYNEKTSEMRNGTLYINAGYDDIPVEFSRYHLEAENKFLPQVLYSMYSDDFKAVDTRITTYNIVDDKIEMHWSPEGFWAVKNIENRQRSKQ